MLEQKQIYKFEYHKLTSSLHYLPLEHLLGESAHLRSSTQPTIYATVNNFNFLENRDFIIKDGWVVIVRGKTSYYLKKTKDLKQEAVDYHAAYKIRSGKLVISGKESLGTSGEFYDYHKLPNLIWFGASLVFGLLLCVLRDLGSRDRSENRREFYHYREERDSDHEVSPQTLKRFMVLFSLLYTGITFSFGVQEISLIAEMGVFDLLMFILYLLQLCLVNYAAMCYWRYYNSHHTYTQKIKEIDDKFNEDYCSDWYKTQLIKGKTSGKYKLSTSQENIEWKIKDYSKDDLDYVSDNVYDVETLGLLKLLE